MHGAQRRVRRARRHACGARRHVRRARRCAPALPWPCVWLPTSAFPASLAPDSRARSSRPHASSRCAASSRAAGKRIPATYATGERSPRPFPSAIWLGWFCAACPHTRAGKPCCMWPTVQPAVRTAHAAW